jgi:hypothetical protein
MSIVGAGFPMRVSNMLAGALGAAIVAGSPAPAAVMMATFYGSTDFGGHDYAGLFGTPDSSLAYKSMSLTFVYDTALGARVTTTGEDIVVQSGGLNPILSASITIDGVTLDLDLPDYGYASSTDDYWTWLSARGTNPANYDNELSAMVIGSGMPGDLETPFMAYGYGGGSLRLWSPTNFGEALAETDFNLGGVEVTYVDPSSPGPVPEPTTWALMIAGFGLAGAALRARRLAAS